MFGKCETAQCCSTFDSASLITPLQRGFGARLPKRLGCSGPSVLGRGAIRAGCVVRIPEVRGDDLRKRRDRKRRQEGGDDEEEFDTAAHGAVAYSISTLRLAFRRAWK